jgi:hypothetical protein
VDDLAYGLPGAAIEAVVVSPDEQTALTWLNSGQGQRGYELYTLDGPLRRLGIGEIFTLRSMYEAPAFSPSGRLVACSPGLGAWWVPPEELWSDDWVGDEWSFPSLGGPTDFATVLVHDVERDAVSHHTLRFDLPTGWVPDDTEVSRWIYGAIGIAFHAEERLEITLPHGVPVELTLPLSAITTLPPPPRALPPPP